MFEQDRQRVAVRPDADSGAYSLPFQANFDGYPHTGGMDSAVLASLSGSPVDGLRKTNGVFAVDVPTSVYLPPEGVQPEKQLIFYRFQVKTSSTVPSGPRTSRYATPYPLDTRELRKSFYAASKPEMDGTLTVELEPEIPELGYTNLSVQRLRSNRPLLGASLGTPYRPPADMVPTVGDEPCTNNVNHIDPEPDWYDPEPDNVITNNDSCSCRCNLDGTSLGSFRIRISLGEPAKDELSGYLWTVVTRPTQIRASSFNVLGTDNVHAETNDTGTVTIYCSDNGGRTVVVSNAVNGVAIARVAVNGIPLEKPQGVWFRYIDNNVDRETLYPAEFVTGDYIGIDKFLGTHSQVMMETGESNVPAYTFTSDYHSRLPDFFPNVSMLIA